MIALAAAIYPEEDTYYSQQGRSFWHQSGKTVAAHRTPIRTGLPQWPPQGMAQLLTSALENPTLSACWPPAKASSLLEKANPILTGRGICSGEKTLSKKQKLLPQPMSKSGNSLPHFPATEFRAPFSREKFLAFFHGQTPSLRITHAEWSPPHSILLSFLKWSQCPKLEPFLHPKTLGSNCSVIKRMRLIPAVIGLYPPSTFSVVCSPEILLHCLSS